jgi:hypothetical protein
MDVWFVRGKVLTACPILRSASLHWQHKEANIVKVSFVKHAMLLKVKRVMQL